MSMGTIRLGATSVGVAIAFLYGCSGSGGGDADRQTPSKATSAGGQAGAHHTGGLADGASTTSMEQGMAGRSAGETAVTGGTGGTTTFDAAAGNGHSFPATGSTSGIDSIQHAGAGGTLQGLGGAESPRSQSTTLSQGASGASGSTATASGGSSHSGGSPDSGMAGTTHGDAQAGATALGGATGSLSNCIIAGIGYPAKTAKPNEPCQTCQPSVSTTTWSPLAEGESCGWRSFCQAGSCTTGCVIESKFYAPGTVNPASECEECSLTGPVHTWSPVPGKVCGQVLVAGMRHTCALIDGGVWCWGSNSRHQLGSGTTETHSTRPIPVVGLEKDVTALAAGGDQTCALVNGTVVCWGGTVIRDVYETATPSPVPDLPAGATALAVGPRHACAVVDGGVNCWGYNDELQLGTGSTAQYFDVVVPIAELSEASSVVAGVDFTCAIVGNYAANRVRCWGSNNHYQLGTDRSLNSRTPVTVSLPSGTVSALAAGDGHTCAIVGGAAYCWGYNWHGQLGMGPNSTGQTPKPTQVSGGAEGVTAITAGSLHTCAIIHDVAKCWGANEHGELGTADAPSRHSIPTAPYGLTRTATSVATGDSHTCFVVNREVYCAGENSSGQLGCGHTTSSTIPLKVQF